MIAQCKNCQTKFRVDEAMIQGEGMWVRCSQCKKVFFLENLAVSGKKAVGDQEKSVEIETVKEPSHQDEGAAAQRGVAKDEAGYTKMPKALDVSEIGNDVGDIGKYKFLGQEKAHVEASQRNTMSEEKNEKKQTSRGKHLLYLFLVLLAGGAYFTFFAEPGWQTVFEKIFGMSKKMEEVGPAQVGLTDVRQRLATNITMGTIRVLEGIAINRSAFPMTRIKVKGEVTDAYTVVLGVKESYCGNLLNANELASMTEDQIQTELSNPQGSDVSNDRVMPQNQIPFMIVFTREPAGVVKAFVTPVGAERLLP